MTEEPSSLFGGNGKLKSWNNPDGKCDNCGKKKCRHSMIEARLCEQALVNDG